MRSTCLAVAVTLLALICASSIASAESIQPTVTFELMNLEVSDMPLSIRDVPPHSDDATFSTPGPIADTDYKMRGLLAVNVPVINLGKKTRDSEKSKSKLTLNAKWMMSFGEEAERNYTNAPGTDERGYGAALTYLHPEINGIIPDINEEWVDVFLNWTPELVWFQGNEKGGMSVSLSYARITAETGWDRYDSHEARSHDLLANSFPIGVSYDFGKTAVGLKYYTLLKTGLGSEAGLKGGLSGFVTVGF